MTHLEGLVPPQHERVQSDLLRDIQRALAELPESYIEMIETGETYGMCGSMNVPICKSLRGRNWEAYSATSDHEDGNAHTYGLVTTKKGQIIIDAAISQFIYGFNKVFVGTRDDLRKLVLDPRTKIVNTRSRNNPLEAFQRTWGESSREHRPRSR